MCCIESCVPVRVVWTGLSTEKLLLTSLVGEVSTNLVTVFFGLKEGDKVDTRPHLLTSEFTIEIKAVSILSYHRCELRPLRTSVVATARKNKRVLQFTNTVVVFVETISHNQMHADEVGERLETAGRNIALYNQTHHDVSIETYRVCACLSY